MDKQICPFLTEKNGKKQNCLGEGCFLYNIEKKACVFSTSERDAELLFKRFESYSEQNIKLIKKIGGMIKKSSEPLMKFLEASDNGESFKEFLEKFKEQNESIKEFFTSLNKTEEEIATALEKFSNGDTANFSQQSFTEHFEKIELFLENTNKMINQFFEKMNTGDDFSHIEALIEQLTEKIEPVTLGSVEEKLDKISEKIVSVELSSIETKLDEIKTKMAEINVPSSEIANIEKTLILLKEEIPLSFEKLLSFLKEREENIESTSNNEELLSFFKRVDDSLTKIISIIKIDVSDEEKKSEDNINEKIGNSLFEISNALSEINEEILLFKSDISEKMEEVGGLISNSSVKNDFTLFFELFKESLKKFGKLFLSINENLSALKENDGFSKVGEIFDEKIADVFENLKAITEKISENGDFLQKQTEEVLNAFNKLNESGNRLIENGDENNKLLKTIDENVNKFTDETFGTVVAKLIESNEKFYSLQLDALNELIASQKEMVESVKDVSENIATVSKKIDSLLENNEKTMTFVSESIKKLSDFADIQKEYFEKEDSGIKLKKADEYNKQGVVFLIDKMYDMAIDNFKNAIKLNPNLWGAYNNLGLALLEKGEKEKAVEVFKKLIKLNPNFSESYYHLGMILAQDSMIDKSVELFKKSIKKNPDFVKAYVALGNALEEMDKIDSAIKTWEKALEIDPTLDEIKEKLMTYKSISDDKEEKE